MTIVKAKPKNLRKKEKTFRSNGPADSRRLAGHLSLRVEAKVLGLGGDDTEGVGVTHTASPALDGNDGVALGEDTELDGVVDTPLETLVDILLP